MNLQSFRDFHRAITVDNAVWFQRGPNVYTDKDELIAQCRNPAVAELICLLHSTAPRVCNYLIFWIKKWKDANELAKVASQKLRK